MEFKNNKEENKLNGRVKLRPVSAISTKSDKISLSPIKLEKKRNNNDEFPTIKDARIVVTPTKATKSYNNRVQSHDNIDKDKIFQENTSLRNQVKKFKSETNSLKAELSRINQELFMKDKLIHDMIIDKDKSFNYESANATLNNSGSKKEPTLVINLKRELKELQMKYRQSEEKYENLKKQSRIMKFNEVITDNKNMAEEINKLKEININSNVSKEIISLQENCNKLQKQISILQVEIKNKTDETNKYKKSLNEKLNEITYLKKELELQNDLSRKLKNAENNLNGTFEKKLELLTKENEELNELNNNKDVIIQNLEKNNSVSAVNSFQEKFDELTRENNSLKIDIYEMRERIHELEEIKIKNDYDINNYKDLLKNKNSNIEQFELIQKNFEETITDLNLIIKNYEYDQKQNEISKNELEIIANHLKEDNKEKEKIIENLTNELNKLKQYCNEEIFNKNMTELEIQGDDDLEERIYILHKNFEAHLLDYNLLKEKLLLDIDTDNILDTIKNRIVDLLNITNNKCKAEISTFVNNAFDKNDDKDTLENKLFKYFGTLQIYESKDCERLSQITKTKIKNNEKELLSEIKSFDIKNTGYISFTDLRKVFCSISINLDDEIIEYLIYVMKTYDDCNSSINDLKYGNLLKLLNASEESGYCNTDSDLIAISKEDFYNKSQKILNDISEYINSNNMNIEEVFIDKFIIHDKNNIYNCYYLKQFFNILKNTFGITLDTIEMYCIFNKLKNENNIYGIEVIDFDKLIDELNKLKKNYIRFTDLVKQLQMNKITLILLKTSLYNISEIYNNKRVIKIDQFINYLITCKLNIDNNIKILFDDSYDCMEDKYINYDKLIIHLDENTVNIYNSLKDYISLKDMNYDNIINHLDIKIKNCNLIELIDFVNLLYQIGVINKEYKDIILEYDNINEFIKEDRIDILKLKNYLIEFKARKINENIQTLENELLKSNKEKSILCEGRILTQEAFNSVFLKLKGFYEDIDVSEIKYKNKKNTNESEIKAKEIVIRKSNDTFDF